MTKTNRRWTKEEENILVQAVQANPHNLQQCFREVGVKINRTEIAVMCHWYTVLGNPNNSKYVGTSFLIIGRKSHCINRKITVTEDPVVAPQRQRVTIWNKIKKLFSC